MGVVMKINIGGAIFLGVLIVGVPVGAYVLNRQAEALVDRIAEQEINASGLAPFLPADDLAATERRAHLQRLYGNRAIAYALNLSYERILALWSRQTPGIKQRARALLRPVDAALLDYEIDERFGAGAARLMDEQYQLFLGNKREAELNAYRSMRQLTQGEFERVMRSAEARENVDVVNRRRFDINSNEPAFPVASEPEH